MLLNSHRVLHISCLSLLAMGTWQCRQNEPKAAPNGAGPAPLGLIETLQSGEAGCGVPYSGKEALPLKVAQINSTKFIKGGDAASRNAVLGALSAVPGSLLQLFFTVAGGRIDIDDAPSLCKDVNMTDEERALAVKDRLASCWLAPKDGQPLRLVVQPSPAAIASSLLKLFAFVQAEFFVPLIDQPGVRAPFDTAPWQAYIAGFKASRDQLADAYLTDLKTRGSADLGRWSRHAKAEPANFGHIIYANAVDSYYCSAVSRHTFVTQFPATWAAFTDADNAYAPLAQLGD